MTRKRLWVAVILCLSFCLVPSYAAAAKFKVRVSVELANVRASASFDSEILETVPLGAVLEGDIRKGEWYLVNLPPNDKGVVLTGYIHSSMVELLSTEEVSPPMQQPRPAVQAQQPQYQPAPAAYSGKKSSGFRVLGGLSLANVAHTQTDVTSADTSFRMGYAVGVGLEFAIFHPLSLEIDVMYLQKGFKFEEVRDTTVTVGSDTYSYKDKVTLKGDELSVPVLLKMRFAEGASPYVCGGIEVGYVLSNKFVWEGITLKNDEVENEEHDTIDIKDFTKSLDYSLVFGAGIELSLGGAVLTLDGRYHFGMASMIDADAIEDEYGVTVDTQDWIKPRTIVFLLGFKF
ncbi:MAG: outer membrane beta-barrel protein [Candidatus Aminicenantes bacterium]|nr:outer membrane beta-barrel protein [Candidatus Aminicenantes bacterium]